MSNTPDGGPAFGGSYDEVLVDASGFLPSFKMEKRVVAGMSLRDFFAAQAARGSADVLCDMLEGDQDPMMTQDPVARLEEARRHAKQHAIACFIQADAMLWAREQSLSRPEAQSPAETMRQHLDTFGGQEGR